jgi:nucleoside-diphosphate-sugar epimerase
MPDTVLVAGASGLVGAAVVDRFLDDGWEESFRHWIRVLQQRKVLPPPS